MLWSRWVLKKDLHAWTFSGEHCSVFMLHRNGVQTSVCRQVMSSNDELMILLARAMPWFRDVINP